jgi:hypothetical protein
MRVLSRRKEESMKEGKKSMKEKEKEKSPPLSGWTEIEPPLPPPEDDFETVETPRNDWKPTEKGDRLEGVFVEEFTSAGNGHYEPSIGFRVIAKDGKEFTAWGRFDLLQKMRKVPPGKFVRLTLEGKVGRKFVYQVFRAATVDERENVTVVPRIVVPF